MTRPVVVLYYNKTFGVQRLHFTNTRKMKKTNNNNDDFSNRKDFRRKQINNKFLDKRDKTEETNNSPKVKKQIKRQIEDLKADELWEDWENNYED